MCAQQNLQTRIAGIILAAGQSTRMGRNKQLLPWQGTTVLGAVLEQARRSCLEELIVVLGPAAGRIQQEIDLQGIRVVENPDFIHGQSTSLQAGLAVLPDAVQAALFLLGDQPLVSAATIDRIVETYKESKAAIVLPVYQGQRGNPVLIDRSLFPRLMQLEGDTGARAVFHRYADSICEALVPDSGICRDIDTWEDYQELTGEGKAGG